MNPQQTMRELKKMTGENPLLPEKKWSIKLLYAIPIGVFAYEFIKNAYFGPTEAESKAFFQEMRDEHEGEKETKVKRKDTMKLSTTLPIDHLVISSLTVGVTLGTTYFSNYEYFAPMGPQEMRMVRFANTVPLMGYILNIALRRFLSTDQRELAGKNTVEMQFHNKVLQNTLEQTVLVSLLDAASHGVIHPQMITVMSILFTMGRSMFYFGYRAGNIKKKPVGRGIGFDLNYFPRCLQTLYLCYHYFNMEPSPTIYESYRNGFFDFFHTDSN